MQRCPRVPPRRLPDPARGELLLEVAAVMAMSRALHGGDIPSLAHHRVGRVAHYASEEALGYGEWVLAALAAEARALMERCPPDEVIDRCGRPYLERWHLLRDGTGRTYLHRWRGDDPDLGLHDHPADSLSLVIAGGLRERWLAHGALPGHCIATRDLPRGAVTYRTAACAHQLRVATPDVVPLTLFVFGPRAADAAWGFWVPDPDGDGTRKVRMRHPPRPDRDWECPQCGDDPDAATAQRVEELRAAVEADLAALEREGWTTRALWEEP